MLLKVWMDYVNRHDHAFAGPQAWLLDNGTRLHLQHGPIDLVIEATGEHVEVQRAYQQATVAFQYVLQRLVTQLPILRKTYQASLGYRFIGPVAARMRTAVEPFAAFNVTPMIAVAGAVADHVLATLIKERNLIRAQVNNGGDIALFLSRGETVKIGICTHPNTGEYANTIAIKAQHEIGELLPVVGKVEATHWESPMRLPSFQVPLPPLMPQPP